MYKGAIDQITVVPIEKHKQKGTSFIAAMTYDKSAELYRKGSKEYKESEEHRDLFWDKYYIQ